MVLLTNNLVFSYNYSVINFLKGASMEIIINEQVKIEWIIGFCILLICVCYVVRSFFVERETEKSKKTAVLVLVAFITILMFNPFLSSLDNCFNNTRIAVVEVEEIILSANLTKINTVEHMRNFRISTTRDEDSILESYFSGHICEVEYLEFGRDIIKIKVLD